MIFSVKITEWRRRLSVLNVGAPQQQALLELYQKLGEAEAQSLAGLPTISHHDFMKKLKDQLNEQKI